jgi:hypothetical protein
VLTVEDWGVGMRPEDMAAANELLATPRDVDLSVSQRLGLHVVARLAQRHGIDVSLTPTPGCGVTAAIVLPPSLFADAAPGSDEAFGDEETPAGVVPALAASVTPTPAADLPPAPPPPPSPPGWSPAAEQQWVDLTDGAPAAGNGGRAGEPAPSGLHPGERVPNGGAGNGDGERWAGGDGDEWSGWWEPSPEDLRDGEPISPLAARPPLSERVQAPYVGTPGTPGSHPRMPGPPEREGSPTPERAAPAVHSPRAHDDALHHEPLRPAPAQVGGPAPGTGEEFPANGPVLSRRVPQAHLAPELRRSGQGPAAAQPDAPLPDAAEARAALSRYQASRQAARAVVEEGDDPERPASGGWS